MAELHSADEEVVKETKVRTMNIYIHKLVVLDAASYHQTPNYSMIKFKVVLFLSKDTGRGVGRSRDA